MIDTLSDFQHAIDSLDKLGFTKKTLGYGYILEFLTTCSVVNMHMNTATEFIEQTAEKHKVSKRSVEDNMTTTFLNVWQGPDAQLLHELFRTDNSETTVQKPKLRNMLIILLLFVESQRHKNAIYADFFGYCLRNRVTIDFSSFA